MHFVDEENYVAGCFYFFDQLHQASFKVAPGLAAGQHGGQVQLEDAFAFQLGRHVACCYALSYAFHDGSFAYAGFAQKDGIAFRFASKHADGFAYFCQPADDRAELPLLGLRYQVGAEAFHS